MTFEEFKAEVAKGPESEHHAVLLKHVRDLIDISRGDMSRHYTTWDNHDAVFRSRRSMDKSDVEAEAKGKPAKLVVPLTFNQVMTFVAFSIMSITQNRRFFELEPTGTEDNILAEPIELILERDLRRNQWITFLVQFFLNIGRFSLGAAEVCYKEEFRYMRLAEEVEEPGAFGVVNKRTAMNYKKIPVFQGNKIYNLSPYRFYPDTRLGDLSRYQEGEFCGSEDVFSLSSLRGMGDLCFNLDKIPKYTEEGYKNRREVSRVNLGIIPEGGRTNPNLGAGSGSDTHSVDKQTTGPVVITKCVFQAIPKSIKTGANKPETLGEEDFPVRYVVWYANDATIVYFEEYTYLHGMYPYVAGQYLPDQQEIIGESLATICEQITNLVTWKLNAHVTSIRSGIQGKTVIDPAGVDVARLNSESPYIYLKKNASLNGVDKYIKQFNTVDNTMNVMKDVSDLDALLEKITGWSSQMQGQYSTGRRSATQDRVVAQGAGARGKTTLGSIWDTAFEPLAKQLLINNRQEMDFETFDRIVGDREWPYNTDAEPVAADMMGAPVYPRYTTEEVYAMFAADPYTLATSEDFFVFDGTNPSEKAFLAQSMQETLMQILSAPEVAAVLGFDAAMVKGLFDQIQLLRGVTPARLPTPPAAQTQAAAANAAAASTATSGAV